MIPPIAPSLLTANPQFALVHKQLTTQLLNSDASTQSTSTQYEPTAKKLKQHHIQAAQHDILKRSLHSLITDKTLPADLVDLIVTIATYISESPNMALSSEAHDLMTPEVEIFQDKLPILAPILSRHIQHEVEALLPLALPAPAPSPSPSTLTPAPSSQPLSTALTTRLTRLGTLRTATLPTSTTNLATTLATLLSTRTAHLRTLIRHLELHVHGTHARHMHARATYLSSVAAGLDAKLRILALQTQHALYTPAVQRALSAYAAHLRDFRSRLQEREELCERELELYEEVGGGEGLRECARRYAVLGKEIEVVRTEIARLKGEGEDEGRGKRERRHRA